MKNFLKLAFLILLMGIIGWYVRRERSAKLSQEKVLVTATVSQISSFDPIRIRDSYSVYEAAKVYEGLLTYVDIDLVQKEARLRKM